MNKEELIGKLQMVYVGDRNALNELIGYYDGLKQGIDELKQENQKLKEQLQQKEDIVNKAKEKLDKANKKIENMFDNGNENRIIDDLLELQKILNINKGE